MYSGLHSKDSVQSSMTESYSSCVVLRGCVGVEGTVHSKVVEGTFLGEGWKNGTVRKAQSARLASRTALCCFSSSGMKSKPREYSLLASK